MNPLPEIPKGPEALANMLNPETAAGERIGQMNSMLVGKAFEFSSAILGIGVLVYGFRKLYEKTLGKVL